MKDKNKKRPRKDHIKDNIKHPGNSTYAPQSPAEAHHAAAVRSRAEYAPTVNAIKADNRASAQRQKDITGWYGELGDQINQGAAATDASYSAANAAMKANIDAAAAAAQKANAGVAGQDAEFAKLTGADPTAFAPSVQEGSAAAAQRSLTEAALAAPISQAGAAQAGYLRTTGINARHEGIYQRGQESKRQQKIKQDLLAARKERAQKTEANYAETAERERDRGLEKWKVNKAFPLEQAGLRQDENQFNATQAQKRREAEQRERENKEDNAGNGGGEGKKIDGNHVRRAYGFLENYWQEPPKKNSLTGEVESPAGRKVMEGWSDSQMISQLMAKSEGITFAEAKRAVAKWRKRHSTGGTGTAQGHVHR